MSNEEMIVSLNTVVEALGRHDLEIILADNKRLREENERLKEQLKEEGERVARELEGLMTAHIGRYQTAYVMQLWREGRK